MPMSPAWVARYLGLLGVERAAPGLAALTSLTRAHLATVPFENVTSILRRHAASDGPVPPPDPDQLLANWEHRRGGGVCFEIAEMVWRLLGALGYPAYVALGCTRFLGSHQAVVVELADGRYLVDVGNGAPFFEPIPLDRPTEVHRAGLGYRFRPEATDRCVQDRWLAGAWQPFCHYELGRADPAVREAAYQRHHTRGQSWVVDSLRLVRCGPTDQVHVYRDGELSHYTPAGKRTRPVADPATLAAEVFHLPGLPVEAARRALAARPAMPTGSHT